MEEEEELQIADEEQFIATEDNQFYRIKGASGTNFMVIIKLVKVTGEIGLGINADRDIFDDFTEARQKTQKRDAEFWEYVMTKGDTMIHKTGEPVQHQDLTPTEAKEGDIIIFYY